MYSSVGGSSSVRMSSTADLPHVSIARLTFSESTSTSSSTETLLSIRTLRRCPSRSILYHHAALASPVPPGPSTSFQFIARASVGHTKSRRRVTFTNAGPSARCLAGWRALGSAEAMAHDRKQIEQLARTYTDAWCSRDPARVAAHYAPGGMIAINGADAVGIADAAEAFIAAFPDIEV